MRRESFKCLVLNERVEISVIFPSFLLVSVIKTNLDDEKLE